jgi:hypothetical protein
VTAGLTGTNGAAAVCGYAALLPGGLLAGHALWQAAPASAPGRTGFCCAALGLWVHVLATGLVPRAADWWPASWLNEGAFHAGAGFPVVVLEALCATAGAVGLLLGHPLSGAATGRDRLLRRALLAVAVILAAGIVWSGTRAQGTHAQPTSPAGARDGAQAKAVPTDVVAEQGDTAVAAKAKPTPADLEAFLAARRRRGRPIFLAALGITVLLIVVGVRIYQRRCQSNGS